MKIVYKFLWHVLADSSDQYVQNNTKLLLMDSRLVLVSKLLRENSKALALCGRDARFNLSWPINVGRGWKAAVKARIIELGTGCIDYTTPNEGPRLLC